MLKNGFTMYVTFKPHLLKFDDFVPVRFVIIIKTRFIELKLND